MRQLGLLGFCLILLFSCKKENMGDCFKGTGAQDIAIRQLPEFDSIYVNRRLHVVLIEDTAYYAVVSAGSNLQDLIVTEVNNGKLTLRNDNKCNWVRSYKNEIKIEVHYTTLRHIVMWGSSDITNEDTLKTPELKVEFRDASGNVNLLVDNQQINIIQHTGSSDVNITGKTKELSVYMSSLGTGDYDELLARNVYVQTLSSSYCRVFATDTFRFKVDGDGSIYYKGDGEVISFERSGNGTIVPIL